jgi:hypothetical protein
VLDLCSIQLGTLMVLLSPNYSQFCYGILVMLEKNTSQPLEQNLTITHFAMLEPLK